jgi:Gnt-I system high-affinity gluconate transporter
MPLVVVALAVALLLLLMTKFKFNGFVALLIVAIAVGLVQGMGLEKTYESIVDGVGGQLDDLVLILGLGAMLGKILADSGAAQKIASTLVNFFGVSRVQLAIVLSAFCIGITMFYEVGFVILIPLVFTIVREYKLPLLWVGLPMSITLSTMHSFLPPHPGPAAVAGTFEASMGLTLLYGLCIAIPAAALVAFTWPRLPFIKRMDPQMPVGLITEQEYDENEIPSFGKCIFIVLIPVFLMGASAVAELSMKGEGQFYAVLTFVGESPIALLVALLFAVVMLGPHIASHTVAADAAAAKYVDDEDDAQVRAVTSDEGSHLHHDRPNGSGAGEPGASGVAVSQESGGGVAVATRPDRYAAAMKSAAESVKPMAMIILVIGAGGAFKQVLVDSGIGDYVVKITEGWDVSPLILAWGIAVLMRICLGSATVAVVTAAGIVLPLVATSGISPELMVLAVTCGSIACSHVNDPGFWLFKEYFGLSVGDAIKSRTTYTTVLSIIGLGGVLLLSLVVG